MEGFTEGSIKNRSWLDVPDERKRENGGTYEQAPEDSPYAGEWFETGGIVAMFSGGKKPWELAEQQAEGGGYKTKPGVVDIYGAYPVARDYPSGMAYRVARTAYRQANDQFIAIGDPPFGSDEERASAKQAFAAFGMGSPIYFQTASGWWVRFRDPSITNEDRQGFYTVPDEVDLLDFEMSAHTAITAPHLVIANYQVRAVIEARRIEPGVMLGDVTSTPHPLLTGVSV